MVMIGYNSNPKEIHEVIPLEVWTSQKVSSWEVIIKKKIVAILFVMKAIHNYF